jgi:hypothetical protein
VTVSGVNDAPVVASALTSQNATQGVGYSFTVPIATFKDADAGDTLAYTASRSDGTALPVWLSFNAATRILSGTPGNGDVGTVNLKVTVRDVVGASVASAFSLNVTNVNDNPTLSSAIPDRAATEDTAFSYAVPANTFADADIGDVLTYSASRANGTPLPAWLAFDPATRTFSGTPLNGDVGTVSNKSGCCRFRWIGCVRHVRRNGSRIPMMRRCWPTRFQIGLRRRYRLQLHGSRQYVFRHRCGDHTGPTELRAPTAARYLMAHVQPHYAHF